MGIDLRLQRFDLHFTFLKLGFFDILDERGDFFQHSVKL